MSTKGRCWAEVDLGAIERNFRAVERLLPEGTKIMAVVKADAYGHGAAKIGPFCERLGACALAVACLEEALVLRENGCSGPILILGYTEPSEAKTLAAQNITQTVYSGEYAEALLREGEDLSVQVKVDTGMRRVGFVPEDIDGMARVYETFHCTGIYTHFSCADEPEEDSLRYTSAQESRFREACAALRERGIEAGQRHAAATASAIALPGLVYDAVRLGIGLYGLQASAHIGRLLPLEPAMRWQARIAMVKDLQPGEALSYGRTFQAEKPLRVATVSAGYADGYPRLLSNTGRMLVRGEYAPVIGRVCMDSTMLDVTGIENVRMGDIATLVGEEGGKRLSFDELAAQTSTINYERCCAVSPRVKRIYRD